MMNNTRPWATWALPGPPPFTSFPHYPLPGRRAAVSRAAAGVAVTAAVSAFSLLSSVLFPFGHTNQSPVGDAEAFVRSLAAEWSAILTVIWLVKVLGCCWHYHGGDAAHARVGRRTPRVRQRSRILSPDLGVMPNSSPACFVTRSRGLDAGSQHPPDMHVTLCSGKDRDPLTEQIMANLE